jgi:hypothetical protein
VSSRASSAVAASDLLTRTTLLFEGAAPVAAIAAAVRALKKVPGVLLAEHDAANAVAFVAHDSGVAAEALLAAAARAGAPAHIEARPALVAEGCATPRRPPGFVQLGAFALLPLVLFAVGSQLFRGGGLHWPVLICCLVFVLLVSLRRSA